MAKMPRRTIDAPESLTPIWDAEFADRWAALNETPETDSE
jgi:hypothetical protein